ncbi:MAG: hypothetical protein R3244_05050, partial [Thermoanaerobaculia bacterium]|nr:hypothetical protein [Thermoanaerobaculia bacterium]
MIADDDDLGGTLVDGGDTTGPTADREPVRQIRRRRQSATGCQDDRDGGQLGVELVAVRAAEGHLLDRADVVRKLHLDTQEVELLRIVRRQDDALRVRNRDRRAVE